MKKPTIFSSPEDLHDAAADYVIAAFNTTVNEKPYFDIALSGGTTPKALYRKLCTSRFIDLVDWAKIRIFFGDERFVPHEHEDSNYRMSREAMLDRLPIPLNQIFPIPTTQYESADDAAQYYHETLLSTLEVVNQIPQFDLVLLGLGPDGHTASLFPETPILREYKKFCAAVYVEKFNSWRISITYPVINNALRTLLLSEGGSKAEIVKTLLDTPDEGSPYPVQHVRSDYQFQWYMDKAAAALL